MRLLGITPALSLRATLLSAAAATLLAGGTVLSAPQARAECVGDLATGLSTHSDCTDINTQTGREEAARAPVGTEPTIGPAPVETGPADVNTQTGFEESAQGQVDTEIVMTYGLAAPQAGVSAQDRSPALYEVDQADN